LKTRKQKQLTRLENRNDTTKIEWINGREYERRTYGSEAMMKHATSWDGITNMSA